MEKTLGEKRVRVDFNVTGNGNIDAIKVKSAELINICEDLKNEGAVVLLTSEKSQLFNLAQRAYEEAAMWAVKAITCPENE